MDYGFSALPDAQPRAKTETLQPPPELIVCRSESQRRFVSRQIGDRPNVKVVGPKPGPSDVCGSAFMRITICEGVDLDYIVGGEGPLGTISRKRQMTRGVRAVFLEL